MKEENEKLRTRIQDFESQIVKLVIEKKNAEKTVNELQEKVQGLAEKGDVPKPVDQLVEEV